MFAIFFILFSMLTAYAQNAPRGDLERAFRCPNREIGQPCWPDEMAPLAIPANQFASVSRGSAVRPQVPTRPDTSNQGVQTPADGDRFARGAERAAGDAEMANRFRDVEAQRDAQTRARLASEARSARELATTNRELEQMWDSSTMLSDRLMVVEADRDKTLDLLQASDEAITELTRETENLWDGTEALHRQTEVLQNANRDLQRQVGDQVRMGAQ